MANRVGLTRDYPRKQITGESAFAELQAAGSIPADATYSGYDAETGEVSYSIPSDAQKALQELQAKGEAPADAKITGYDESTGKVYWESPSMPSKPDIQDVFNYYLAHPVTKPVEKGSVRVSYNQHPMFDAWVETVKVLEASGQQVPDMPDEIRQELLGSFETKSDATVTFSTGETISKTDYDALTTEDKKLIADLGVEGFNTEKQRQYQEALAAAQKAATITGEEAFKQLQSTGAIPTEATYISFNSETGEVTYSLPQGQATIAETPVSFPTSGQVALDQLIQEGTIPSDSILQDYDPLTGTVTYALPTKTTQIVEVETPTGKVQMTKEDWDALSDIKQYEVALGREPTLTEWTAYRLNELREKYNITEGDIRAYYLIPGLGGLIGTISKIIPETQKGELIVTTTEQAQREYVATYPSLSAVAIVSDVLSQLGFAAAKALNPQVTIKDVTVEDWAITGLSASLWTMPLWLPKVAKVVKYKIPETTAKLTPAKLRTEFQQNYLLAKEAGTANLAMQKATNLVKTTEVASPQYMEALTNLSSTTKKSISADLAWLDRFQTLKTIKANQLKSFEQASGMTGLTNATNKVISTRQAFENSLKAVDAVPETNIAQRLLALENVTRQRLKFVQALDEFGEIAQPRAIGWRVPSQERTIWGEGEGLVETGEYGLTTKPVNPEFQKLLDEVNNYLLEHPQVAPESKGGVAVALKPQKVVATPEVVLEPKLKAAEKIALGETTPEAGIQTKAPEAVTTPKATTSVFPGITTKTGTTYEPKTDTLIDEQLGAMTPEQRQRLAGDIQEKAVDAYSTQKIIETIDVTKVTTPEIIKEATREQLKSTINFNELSFEAQQALVTIISDAVLRANELQRQNLTNTQLRNMLNQAIQTRINMVTNNQLRQQLETLTQVVTDVVLKTQLKLQTAIATKLGIGISTGVGIFKPTTTVEGTDEDRERIGKLKGIVEWRHGMFWKVIPPPYDKIYHFRQPIAGTYRFATGEGSAEKTIQVINGKPPRDMDLDIGIALAHLRASGDDMTLDFTQDASDAYKGKSIIDKIHNIPKTRTRKPKAEIDEYEYETPRDTYNSRLSQPLNSRRKSNKGASELDRYYLGRRLRPAPLGINI